MSARLTHLSEQTIAYHAKIMDIFTVFVAFDSKLETSHLRCLGSQHLIVDGFLNYILNRFVLDCPTGQASQDGLSVMIMSSDRTKFGNYEDYIDLFDNRRGAVNEITEAKIPTALLKFSVLTNY